MGFAPISLLNTILAVNQDNVQINPEKSFNEGALVAKGEEGCHLPTRPGDKLTLSSDHGVLVTRAGQDKPTAGVKSDGTFEDTKQEGKVGGVNRFQCDATDVNKMRAIIKEKGGTYVVSGAVDGDLILDDDAKAKKHPKPAKAKARNAGESLSSLRYKEMQLKKARAEINEKLAALPEKTRREKAELKNDIDVWYAESQIQVDKTREAQVHAVETKINQLAREMGPTPTLVEDVIGMAQQIQEKTELIVANFFGPEEKGI